MAFLLKTTTDVAFKALSSDQLGADDHVILEGGVEHLFFFQMLFRVCKARLPPAARPHPSLRIASIKLIGTPSIGVTGTLCQLRNVQRAWNRQSSCAGTPTQRPGCLNSTGTGRRNRRHSPIATRESKITIAPSRLAPKEDAT